MSRCVLNLHLCCHLPQINGSCEVRRSQCTQQPDCQHEPLAPETVGTTAVVLAVTAEHLVVANAGDSRAVLSRGGQAVALSKDHKVTAPWPRVRFGEVNLQ